MPSASALAFFDDLLLVSLERGLQRLVETDRLGRDDVHERAALDAGEHLRIDLLRVFFLAEDQCRRAGRARSCAWWS